MLNAVQGGSMDPETKNGGKSIAFSTIFFIEGKQSEAIFGMADVCFGNGGNISLFG